MRFWRIFPLSVVPSLVVSTVKSFSGWKTRSSSSCTCSRFSTTIVGTFCPRNSILTSLVFFRIDSTWTIMLQMDIICCTRCPSSNMIMDSLLSTKRSQNTICGQEVLEAQQKPCLPSRSIQSYKLRRHSLPTVSAPAASTLSSSAIHLSTSFARAWSSSSL